ncbi:MAG: leucyl aminopeptidase [Gemmatimonadota bacterium]|nr:leucyl aminopeptidase [Gemmatimonadota bacterium]
MQVRYVAARPSSHTVPLLAVGVLQGTTEPSGVLAEVDGFLDGAATRLLASGDFTGRDADEALFYASGDAGPRRVLLLGMGKEAKVDAERIRRFAARAVRGAEARGVTELAVFLEGHGRVEAAALAQAAAEGAVLAGWSFRELKTRDAENGRPPVQVESVDLLGEGDAEVLATAAGAGAVIATGENVARTLQSRPGNVATPSHLAEEVEAMGREVGFQVTVFDEARMKEEGMHAILAVSAGSHEEARFIVMEHRGGVEGEAPLVLVGKGLTFDAGGISLKPPAGMEEMKFDMSGGAAVIGAMKAIVELGVKANVVGIVPSSENLPSGTAVKPGDVIGTLAGKTVEVINTDAEGRLILADALTWGSRLKPAAMVDCATLTGAVVVALGSHAAAVLGNDDGLIEELRGAGSRSGERCWPLPLWDEYGKQLESATADLLNVGGRPAGTITAACFLSEFVGDTVWAHLDIAGTAYGDGKLPYQRKGGYGFPTRLLVEWVRSRTS